jgi:hypothetical protein
MCATRRKSVFFRTRRVFNLDYVSIKNPASLTEKSHFSYLVAQITILDISGNYSFFIVISDPGIVLIFNWRIVFLGSL